jgi:hypothetical protein
MPPRRCRQDLRFSTRYSAESFDLLLQALSPEDLGIAGFVAYLQFARARAHRKWLRSYFDDLGRRSGGAERR